MPQVFKIGSYWVYFWANENVPCEECEQCEEKYYTDEVAEQLEKMVDMAKQMVQEIAVLDYSKVA